MKIISKYKYSIFCFLVAFIFLLITSKSSFLYAFNDWVDANAFFTVGKSMFNGVVPYKEIFEQKGLLLYLIYGVGYLFSNYSFHGVFVLEVISFSIFLYYIHKTIDFYFDKKYTFIILPILTFIITTSRAFVQGGSCEEFCLPFFAVSLYYFIKYFKDGSLTNKEIIINGLMAGCVLMMKYTMLGFWIGFVFFIFLDLIIKKKYKEGIMFCFKFLLGMIIPFSIGLIYLFITGGVKDFFEDYFIINMTSYVNYHGGIFERFIRIFRIIYRAIRLNGPFILIVLGTVPILVWFIKEKSIYFKISLIGLFGFTAFFIYWGLKIYKYYSLPLIFLSFIALLGLFSLLKKYIDNVINKKYMVICFVLIFVIFAVLTYFNANFILDMKRGKNDYFHYKYTEYINKYDNPTLLNMGYLDFGLYTTTGIVPNVKFFELQNIAYENFPENLDEMEKYVRNKEIKFVLYTTAPDEEVAEYIYENYEEVYADQIKFEDEEWVMHLFKLKELEEK